MAGDGPLKIGSTNGFAVLESLKRKKKSHKDSSKNKGPSKNNAKDIERPVFWNPKPLVNKSWADVEDEDDDDYYVTSAPLQGIWGSSSGVSNQKKEIEDVIEEESESEDGLDEGDEDVEEEAEPEPEVPIPGEPAEKKPSPVTTSAPKDTERQLSKKELKKKGLEELDALLAELGISGKDNNRGHEHSNEGKRSEEQNGDGGKESTPPVPTESKTSKKKKSKKDKSSKEAKDALEQRQPNGDHTDNNGNADVPVVKDAEDVKERLKKVVLTKKKRTNKEMDAAAKAAAIEAAARSARLAVAKKKEKNHYNQQPVR